jgi:hypothetical protein
MAEKKITFDGAVMRNKLRGQFANEIARKSLSTEGRDSDNDGETLDSLILRARAINASALDGEVL